MKSISSSIFGRFFGNTTKVIIDQSGLTISVNHNTTQVSWQQLTSPPLFIAGWLGHTLVFNLKDEQYVLSKLAYRIEQQQDIAEQYWIAKHQHRLQKLIANIDNFVKHRYLRQSAVNKMRGAVNAEYQRWFPWSTSSTALQQVTPLVQRLSDYQHWQPADFTTCREAFINKQLVTYQAFFDNVEANPLTQKQRRACVIDDDNNLLLAGAGTGKTSVMVGRAGYLLNSHQATHDELLLLAYGKKAAMEMDQRINEKLGTDKIRSSTFHRLGLTIIEQVEGNKPKLSAFAEDEKAKAAWVQNYFEQLINQQSSYRLRVLQYFSQHYYVEKHHDAFAHLGDYYQYLTDNDMRTLKGERVKSVGAMTIANWLFNHGIDYQYAENYPFTTVATTGKQYQPDFFLPALKLYIDYYEVDQQGDTASYIDKDQYHAGMHNQRQIHLANNTQCIELTYAMQQTGTLVSTLSQSLAEHDVEFAMQPEQVMLENLKQTGRITVLAELLGKLMGLYRAAGLNPASEQQIIEDASDSTQTEKALQLLKPIIAAYQTLLANNNEIDFDDMIIKALGYVESGQFNSPWRYIMVDEFQDISKPRARLVKALRDSNKGCSLFAVGDDWQAIYRFSGADVSLTTGFADFFGKTTQTELDQTFRFNNKIGALASDFVSKNPFQINKTIHSLKQVDRAAVSILRRATTGVKGKNNTQGPIAEIDNGALDAVLTAISRRVTKPTRVYLLARLWFQLPNKNTVDSLNSKYPLLTIEAQSFHGSKGKESDVVVILGLSAGKYAFPSNKATPAVMDALLAKQEVFDHAEERRLFYVALTRGKDRVYIISDPDDSCVFVDELIAEHEVELNEFVHANGQAIVETQACAACKTGRLTSRLGRYGRFYACSHFPRCSHKESACEKCGSAMTNNKQGTFKSCLNTACHLVLPLCTQCGDEMVLRKGPTGEFWGCKNFSRVDQRRCKNTLDSAKIVWPAGYQPATLANN